MSVCLLSLSVCLSLRWSLTRTVIRLQNAIVYMCTYTYIYKDPACPTSVSFNKRIVTY